jgi:hypothetical protein
MYLYDLSCCLSLEPICAFPNEDLALDAAKVIYSGIRFIVGEATIDFLSAAVNLGNILSIWTK